MIVDKPWGREEVLVPGPPLRMKVLSIDPGERLSLQYHDHKEEVMFVLAGVGSAMLGDRAYPLGQGDSVHIPPGALHRLGAARDGDGLVVLEVSTGAGDEDITRVEDDHGRAG